MGLIFLIMFGGLVGWIASIFMKNNQSPELISNIIVGMVGAIIGILFAQSVGGENTGQLSAGSFVFALFGAVLLLMVVKGFSNFNKY